MLVVFISCDSLIRRTSRLFRVSSSDTRNPEDFAANFNENRAAFTRSFAQIHKKKYDFSEDLKQFETQEGTAEEEEDPVRLIEDLHRK